MIRSRRDRRLTRERWKRKSGVNVRRRDASVELRVWTECAKTLGKLHISLSVLPHAGCWTLLPRTFVTAAGSTSCTRPRRKSVSSMYCRYCCRRCRHLSDQKNVIKASTNCFDCKEVVCQNVAGQLMNACETSVDVWTRLPDCSPVFAARRSSRPTCLPAGPRAVD